jgi:hypothetical protein
MISTCAMIWETWPTHSYSERFTTKTVFISVISCVYYIINQNETFKTNFTFVDLFCSMWTNVSHEIASFKRLLQNARLKRFSALWLHHIFHTWMICHQCCSWVMNHLAHMSHGNGEFLICNRVWSASCLDWVIFFTLTCIRFFARVWVPTIII